MTDLKHLALEAKLTMDISSYARQIELECSDVLLPAPAGIYVRSRLEPVMVDGQAYYTREGTTTELVTDINETNKNIYNEAGKLVVPKSYLLDKAKMPRFVSNMPFLPYRGSKILELLINQQIDTFVQYRKSHDYPARLLRQFITLSDGEIPASEQYDQIYMALDNAYMPIKVELDLFLGKFDWHMYHVKLVDNLIMVERYCDWRVHAWEQEHGEAFRKG